MLFRIFLGFLFCSLVAGLPAQQTLSVMTFNIRYDNPKDGLDNWGKRKEGVVQLIKDKGVQVLGIQEGLVHQVKYMDEQLTGYQFLGVGRDDGKEKGEFSALFIDTSFFSIDKSGTFWLSPTPDTVSIGWDAALERICTYARLIDKKTNKPLWVFNTHFDHKGQTARLQSATLLVRKIFSLKGSSSDPVLLMGDLNLLPTEMAIRILSNSLEDAYAQAPKETRGPEGTFNGFDLAPNLDRRIDYVFSRGLLLNHAKHLDDRLPNNRFPSDHLPVMAVFEWRQ